MKWITALNLEQWANTMSARVQFPGLIADLIRASATSLSSFRFPRGDKGQVRGFDGVLDAESTCVYVPDGESVWEFGVTEAGAAKATQDYEKRTQQVDDETRQSTTFVFVSPRTWDGGRGMTRDAWLKEKRALAQWKDVWYIDGSMLEDWLDICPAVAARYAKYELQTLPAAGVRSTDEFWDEFSTRFAPQLIEQVLLAGREDQALHIVQQLNSGVGRLMYAADSPDEVVAFTVAAIRCEDPAVRFFLESKTLVVDTEDAARQLSNKKGHVFLLRGQARNLAGLLARNCPTVVSAGADEKRSDHVLLNRPESSQLATAFVAMGYEPDAGYDLARRCGRSLAVLARLLASGNAHKPEWFEKGELLIPALLAGGWHASTKPDIDVLCGLAETDDYESIESPLRRLARLQDPPLDRVGDVWAMRAPVDAFVHLGHLLGRTHLLRFSEAVTTVFSQVNEPPKATDVFKSVSERNGVYSSWLKDGLMTTLLHMAVLNDQAGFTVTGSTPAEFVDDIVRKLPGLAADHRLLAAMQDQLSLLAEAAPIPFLDALEQLLEGDSSGIKPIFDELEGFIRPRAYHYGVLWALEVVAWDPGLLLRASLCLARLAAIDPGGRDSNRPISSLRAIFLSWSPNTSANAKQRIGVLNHVVQSVPEIAWQLLSKLLPQSNDTLIPTQKPKFREYLNGETEVLTYGMVWESQTAVINLALAHVGHAPDRWGTLISKIHQFPEAAFYQTVKALRLEMAVPHEATFEIWDTLRKEVNRHKTFGDTEWALRDKHLAELDSLVSEYAPTDPVQLSSWLFDDWMPDVPGKKDASGSIEAVQTARNAAVAEVYAYAGIAGIIDLVGQVKLPQHVGYAVGSMQLVKEDLLQLLSCALLAGEALDPFASAVLVEVVQRFGSEGENRVRASTQVLALDPARVARLLMSLPEHKTTWDYTATFGNEVEDLYWKTKHSFFVEGSTDELLMAIDQYTQRGRFLAALSASNRRFKELPSHTLMSLVSNALSDINFMQDGTDSLTTHVLERVFDELRIRSDISFEDIASLEFGYLPVFHRRKKPLALHRLMVEQARFFVEIVAIVFKPEHGEARILDERGQRQAVAAYELLRGLHTLPGQTDNQIDDQQLLSWCLEVRELAAKEDCLTMAEQRIGHMLAHAPLSPTDGAWPHEAVRSAIEKLESLQLECGIEVERINMRGVYSKQLGEGGTQERDLALQFCEWAETIHAFPRTSAMLRRISATWTRYAELADREADEDELRG